MRTSLCRPGVLLAGSVQGGIYCDCMLPTNRDSKQLQVDPCLKQPSLNLVVHTVGNVSRQHFLRESYPSILTRKKRVNQQNNWSMRYTPAISASSKFSPTS
uniref:Uncharacterized protein n=1 Tax=Timema genevievae TaxID=629358 RepID=A0A7R9PLY2_TIMGE|nr:unnamed protein product [Timema genevievae]